MLPLLFIKNSNSSQFDWIRLACIPLAHVDILILIDADIMTVLKNRFLL
jgi:hypothetical protein